MLVYEDGNLVSGPLEALIQHLIPTTDYYPDRTYIFAFILSSRMFIKPYQLLSQLTQITELTTAMHGCSLEKVSYIVIQNKTHTTRSYE